MTFAASLLGSSYIIFISICEGMSFSLFSPSITEQRCDQQPFLQKCRREKVCGKRPPCSSPTRHPKLCSTEERLAIIGVEGRENQLRQDIPRYQDFCMLWFIRGTKRYCFWLFLAFTLTLGIWACRSKRSNSRAAFIHFGSAPFGITDGMQRFSVLSRLLIIACRMLVRSILQLDRRVEQNLFIIKLLYRSSSVDHCPVHFWISGRSLSRLGIPYLARCDFCCQQCRRVSEQTFQLLRCPRWVRHSARAKAQT